MKAAPSVSILTITHNRADLIPRCIESIRRQTFADYEHIIVDGASTDGTAQVVESYHDDRIKYVRLEEKGPAVQMAKAFELSSGEYITFLDDDDEYLHEKLEKQVSFMNAQPPEIGLVYCWMAYFDQNSTPPYGGGKPFRIHCPQHTGDVSGLALSRPVICGTPTLMLRRAVIEKAGGIYRDDVGLIGSDWEFAARVCQITKVACLPESLVNVYVNHGHARLTTDLQLDREIVFHRYFLSTYESRFRAEPALAEYHLYNLCIAFIKKRDYKTGLYYYRRLLGSKPSLRHLILPLACLVKR